MARFENVREENCIILKFDLKWYAEKSSDIDPQEAQQTLEIAEAALRKAEGKRQTIEANLTLRRARTRVEAINAIS
ncbi:putative ATP synthase, F1 complex, delta/epsilon subunit [Helianthus annuus]|uniref:ATP synthase, F1 complex, delta/epsilon subunit n=1 Tax=Helianthus annuus TaxID=4232 RepID=A0A251TQQ3_HELAN|nr:putative ATP synthase, F1 complex, delta/epsilon subunit [Helianthus annuus]